MHTPGARPIHRPTCPEHGGPLPCPACAPKEPPPGHFDQIRRDLEEAKTKNAKSANDRRDRRDRTKESR